MPEIAIVGAGGMLGQAFARALEREGASFVGLPRAAIDVTRAASVAEAIPTGTKLILGCAAYTNVDGAEADEAAAHAVNALGPQLLAERAADVGATLVHFSTDYVFNGRESHPYGVHHAIEPINAYGRTKAAGEAAVRRVSADHLIIRTSWLYAPWSANFVRTIARAAAERDVLRVVNDQRGRPSSAEQLVSTTLGLIRAGARGSFHGTDAGECTWFDFATAIAAAVRPACRVEPCTTAEMPRPAPRPSYSVLDISATTALLGPLRPWQDALSSVLERIPS